MATAKKQVLFRPMLPDISPATSPDILFSGTVLSNGKTVELQPEVQHLGGFAGGMFALGGRPFNQDDHVQLGEQLARGCAWAYESFPTGVMPEVSDIIPCEKPDDGTEAEWDNLAPCAWNATRWAEHGDQVLRLPKPFTLVRNPQYLLRPEAIESVFILTRFAHSAITDVLATGYTVKTDSMESFWIAETLKYFYLIFSAPDLVSLDHYVFNTEAHPLKRPTPGQEAW